MMDDVRQRDPANAPVDSPPGFASAARRAEAKRAD